MKYPPQHHQEFNKAHMIEVIRSYPLATLISVSDNSPIISHLPLIYNEAGLLIGHIDIHNPQVPSLKDAQDVTIIFSGPQCYISPSIYSTEQLPTWNYIKVHLKGKVTAIADPEILIQSLIKMTDFLEQPNHKYRLESENSRMHNLLNYIQGFSIEITAWEGKFKLSQDKKPIDIARARTELIRANQEQVETFLDTIF